jgi:hypothetical protein
MLCKPPWDMMGRKIKSFQHSQGARGVLMMWGAECHPFCGVGRRITD